MKLILYITFSIIIYLIFKKEEKSYGNGSHEKCRNCGMEINSDSLNCPYCKVEIKRVCNCCKRLIDIDWRYCPFCENNEQNTEIIKAIGGKE